MRYKVTHLLFRDFGTHNKADIVRRKYKVHIDENAPREEYEWILENERDTISKILANLCNNLTAANSIYPQTMEELNLRRQYQDRAIANCYQLISEFQYIITIFNVNVDKYIPYCDDVNYEIGLIKGWRGSNKKFMPAITKNDEKEKRRQLELDEKLKKELEEKIKAELDEKLKKEQKIKAETEQSA